MTAAKPLARYGAIEGRRSRAAPHRRSYTTTRDVTFIRHSATTENRHKHGKS
jgi:hypothetical protein